MKVLGQGDHCHAFEEETININRYWVYTLYMLADCRIILMLYYIPINDTTSKLSVFWPSDTES